MGEEREKVINILTGEEIDAPPAIAAMIARRRAEAVSPTPAAPAGSGWLTQPADFIPYGKESWQQEAIAQRAAREAAERDFDRTAQEVYRLSAELADCEVDRDRNARDVKTLNAALAASTEREAGLREALAAWIEEQKATAPLSHDSAAYALLLRLEALLASLAAPEGGTTDGD